MKDNTQTQETVAQEALRLLSPIPADEWLESFFTNKENKCCAIGHYTRLKSDNPNDYSPENCDDYSMKNLHVFDGSSFKNKLRIRSRDFFVEKHNLSYTEITTVNNRKTVLEYNQECPKERVLKCLEDMVKAGY